MSRWGRTGSWERRGAAPQIGTGAGLADWHWEISDDAALFPPTVTSFVDGWRPWFGVLEDGPPVVAEVFAREFIQNFADAADELIAERQLKATAGLEFRFSTFSGSRASELRQMLGLDDHAARYHGFTEAERNDHRLAESELLEGSGDDLTLLVAQERYATGMYGPWKADGVAELADGTVIRRKLRDALVKPSGSKSTSTALGSYGEGKRGVILSSRLRTLLAYSCFLPREGEPEGHVTRRMLGVTYWRRHVVDRIEHTGLSLLGHTSDDSRPRPWEDDAADELVESLAIDGLVVRDPSVERDLGTTWLFVDPAFGPEDLARAIERNWWPRLELGTLEIKILDAEATSVEVDPRSQSGLRPFMEAHDLIIGKREADDQRDEIRGAQVSGVGSGTVGRIALTADTAADGWSWDDNDRNAQMAAIVRGGMVIQYVTSPPRRPDRLPPYVRGVFVAEGKEAESLLRLAEPPLHNYWVVSTDTGYPRDAVGLAKAVYGQINDAVRTFARRFKEEKKQQDFQFDTFANFFRVSDKPIVDRPDDDDRDTTTDPWEITRPAPETLEADPVDGSRIRVQATRALQLKDDWPDEALPVKVRLGWRVLEDGDTGIPAPELTSSSEDEVASTFTASGDAYVGTLTKQPAQFSWTSAHYEGDWLTKAWFEVESIQEADSDA